MSEWIKCSEKIPQHEDFVLACSGRGIPLVLQFFVNHRAEETSIWFQQTLIPEEMNPDGARFSLEDFPLWQPLPSPPEDTCAN
ncbi:DUF551 domain-containing protein [Pantoea stewartii]|uniref:DUF551 domain-containing protein n=1 Tax=Pantoea stewartii TaxID=66269 RepID=UPI001981EB3F|nr:DUF551 domain-containing protein [Pantoea stewartii]